jgi:hypothetical protein
MPEGGRRGKVDAEAEVVVGAGVVIVCGGVSVGGSCGVDGSRVVVLVVPGVSEMASVGLTKV